jgi:CHAD domain-containing protein
VSNRTQTFTGGEGHPDRVTAALLAAGFELGAPHVARRVLLDTFDGRLDDANLRLEHRTIADGPELVLTDDRSAPVRLVAPQPPRFAAELAAGPFRSRIGAAADGRALLPQREVAGRATTVVRRNRDGKSVAAATVYDGLTVDGETRPWAVEVTALLGYDNATTRLVDVLHACGLTEAPGDVFDLAGPVHAPGRATASPTIPLDPTAPAAGAFRAVLLHLLDAVETNLPGTIDDVDPEFLHELRVAVRRSRSVLAHATRVLPAEEVTRARAELAWLGAATGPPRDLDVYQLEWDEYVRLLTPGARRDLEPIRLHLDEERRAAHERLAEELGGSRTTQLLTWWRAQLTAPAAELGADGAQPAGTVVRRRISKAHRRLLRDGRAISIDSPSEDVHELRKDAKRLRYLLECFGGLYAAKARKAFVARLKALQDNLGLHQDADVHGRHLRQLANELSGQLPTDTLLAAGQLVEQLEQRRAAMRAEFAGRFAEFDSRPTADALRALLDGGPAAPA